ncbi:MAG TPA: hypothetical protein VM074_12865 [Solimonas sp.]|nr:hypothetical protein [Solimonas sp.]
MPLRSGLRSLLLLTLLAAALDAGAQETRRRPGVKPPEPVVTPPREVAPPEPPAPKPKPRPVPEPEAPARETVPPSSTIVAPDGSERRRPAQPVYTRPNESGERLSPGEVPRGERIQVDPNRRSGLKRIAKPGDGAKYGKERIDDRWRLTQKLGLTDYPWWDPYHQNTLKADRPVTGDWFFNIAVVSDTSVEPRSLPTPVAPQGEDDPGSFDLIGDGKQLLLAQNLGVGLVYYKGNTTFMPPEWEFRFTPVFNVNRAQAEQNRALFIDPAEGRTRNDGHIGVQELFVDKHLWDVSPRYDFDSLRIGIQAFNADFRGFLFRDEQLGIRLFGNRANNVFQYNVAWFHRIEKDTNSGLNDLGQKLRKDDVLLANVYWQDFVVPGFTAEAVLLYNRNDESGDETYFNQNGFIERPASIGIEKPRGYDVVYGGLAGDGHIGWLNISTAGYLVGGKTDKGVFVDRETDVFAGFFASELSLDHDWQRYRLSLLYASGDDEPFDDRETGFDAVFENPLFAGSDTSFWIRQNVPLIGGGGVAISTRNGVLNNLRSSKDEGQSNFTNPGTILLGIGADFDVTPHWRVSGNLNEIGFATTEVVESARQQADISQWIGTDFSLAAIWRPKFSQNIVFRSSAAALLPGKGYEQLFGDEVPYSILLNLILTY